MKGYTEEYKNGTWVKAKPMKASWENNKLLQLFKRVKRMFGKEKKMRLQISQFEYNAIVYALKYAIMDLEGMIETGKAKSEYFSDTVKSMKETEKNIKVRAASYKGKQIYFDESGFVEVSNIERTEDTAVLKTNPKFCILAGYDYGVELWKECFSYLNYHMPFKIVVPSHIEGMSVSFIGGLFAEMIEDIGVDKILERMTIIHPDEDFIKQVVDDIKMYK